MRAYSNGGVRGERNLLLLCCAIDQERHLGSEVHQTSGWSIIQNKMKIIKIDTI